MFRESHLDEEEYAHAQSSSLDFELGPGISGIMRISHEYNHINHHHHHRPHQYQRRGSVPVLDQVEDDGIQWFLFQKQGPISFRLSTKHPILIGSGDNCDIIVQAPSVEKRHALLAFQPNSNCFTVKDLNSTNGTYLNKRRVSADHPETVSNLDLLRFGYAGGTGLFGGGSSSGPSSLPTYYSSQNKTARETAIAAGSPRLLEKVAASSALNEDNNFRRALPPKGGSLPRKSLLTVTKSDPGGKDCETNDLGKASSDAKSASGVLLSDRLFQRRSSGGSGINNSNSYNFSGFHESPTRSLDHHHQCGDRNNLQSATGNVMQQGGSVGRTGTSRVCSPSLTLDSGRGSSSAPSSPAKEMSPVQMTTVGGSCAVPNSGVGCSPSSGGGVGTGMSSNNSHNASPVFARKLSRPMEYLLGQTDDGQSEPGYVPDPPQSGHSSGNFASYCSSEPLLSFVTNGSSTSGCVSGVNFNNPSPNLKQSSRASCERNNNNSSQDHGFSSGVGDCEILQITEDYENTNLDCGARKDSLEEEMGRIPVDQDVTVISNGDMSGGVSGLRQVQPQFLVGGDIMQPDLDVPNEVFGPLSHAEIINRNLSSANSNLNSQHSSVAGSGRQENKPVEIATTLPHARARSSSGDGGSNRSTPLSALYGTPHWWPDSPPPEENANVCPPPPASSTNCSPFKKPFMLNNNTYNIANSQSIATSATSKLRGNSSSSSLTDHVKDLSLESTNSQKSNSRTPSTSPMPVSLGVGSGDATMEVKKPSPMAFTIDFCDSEGGGGTSEAAEAKKAAIAERLSKFAPRHRRNASLTRSDDVVGSKDGDSPSLSSSSKPIAKTNSLGRTKQQQHHHQKQSSATTITVADSLAALKSASLPKRLTGASKHPSGGSSSTNNNDSGLRSLSPETISSTTSSSSRSRPIAEPPVPKASTPKLSSSTSTPREANSGSMTRKSKNQQQNRGGTPARKTIPASNEIRANGPASKGGISARLNDLSKEPSKTSPTSAPVPKTTPAPADKEDTVSEAGTYTVEKEAPEVQDARENIEEIFGLNGTEGPNVDLEKENDCDEEESKSFGVGVEPGTRDWVREWAELAAQQHHQKKRPELPDSQYFLRETETLVSAIQERVSKHMKYGGGAGEPSSLGLGAATGSDSEDDEPTLSHLTPIKSQSQSQQSTPVNTNKRRPPSRASPFHRESSVLSDSGYAIGYQSDSSNEGSRPGDLVNHGIGNKMNRAFNIRRGRVGYDSDFNSEQLALMNQQSMTMNNSARGISPKPPQVNGNRLNNSVSGAGLRSGAERTSSPHFGRNDGGRFSLRMPKSRTPPAQMHPPAPPRQPQKSTSGGESQGRGMNGHKSDNYLSQSQSMNGKKSVSKILNNSGGPQQQSKKSAAGNRSNSTLTAKEVELANWKRRKNYDPMKAAAEGKKGGSGSKKNGMSSETESGVEETAPLPPIASSPQVLRREGMMTKSLSFHQESYSPKCGSEDEDMIYIVDEMDSSHSNSPNHLGMTRSYHEDVMYYGMPGSNTMRQKNKLEALDNLVIATIHSLSNKVRTSSKNLLEKLQLHHASDENGALLEEMVSQLKELEGPSSNSSPNKSPSRELSGTLKNLKKLEQVILVLDKVLCEDFESA